MAAEVHMFPCLSDNFGALIHDPATGATAAIDVPDAAATLAAAKTRGWTFSHILVTHHHPDHVQGIEAVKAATGARVIGNAADAQRIPLVDATVAPGGKARFGSLEADVIDTPGHTVGHIAYHFAAGMMSLLRWWLEQGMPYSPEEMAAHIDRLLLQPIQRLGSEMGGQEDKKAGRQEATY